MRIRSLTQQAKRSVRNRQLTRRRTKDQRPSILREGRSTAVSRHICLLFFSDGHPHLSSSLYLSLPLSPSSFCLSSLLLLPFSLSILETSLLPFLSLSSSLSLAFCAMALPALLWPASRHCRLPLNRVTTAAVAAARRHAHADIQPAPLSAFSSHTEPLRVAVIGTSGGIGRALALRLAANPAVGTLFAVSRSTTDPIASAGAEVHTLSGIDITSEADVARAAAAVTASGNGTLDLVIVATGLLQRSAPPQPAIAPEKTWRDLDADVFLEVMRINTLGPALVGKHFLPLLPRRGRAVFSAISARVGSIGDNGMGGWHAYRASKAALNMLLRNFAIELGRKNKTAVVASLHPGTVATDLSRPFQKGVPEGKLFSTDYSADSLLSVLDGLKPSDSGGFFAWDGERIEY